MRNNAFRSSIVRISRKGLFLVARFAFTSILAAASFRHLNQAHSIRNKGTRFHYTIEQRTTASRRVLNCNTWIRAMLDAWVLRCTYSLPFHTFKLNSLFHMLFSLFFYDFTKVMNRISFLFRSILPSRARSGSNKGDGDDNNDRSEKAKLNKQNVNKHSHSHTTTDNSNSQLSYDELCQCKLQKLWIIKDERRGEQQAEEEKKTADEKRWKKCGEETLYSDEQSLKL